MSTAGKKISLNVPTPVRFLHITDCHLSSKDRYETIDRKVKVEGMSPPLREEVLSSTLEELAKDLIAREQNLDGVLFSGDGTNRGDAEGQKRLRSLIIEKLDPVGISSNNIVAVPGNHDIVKGAPPGTSERYKMFEEAWLQDPPVVVPYLDGIDLSGKQHVLQSSDKTWAIFPINTANWCQLVLTNEDYPKLNSLIERVKDDEDLKELVNNLIFHDIARVSDLQMKHLKKIVQDTGDVPLRIAVLHHHTMTVGTREEFKTFADITNLGALRQVLRELDFHIIVHGHKHETALTYDHIYDDEDLSAPPHRVLTISGGTFYHAAHIHSDPMRLIEIEHALHAPRCTISRIPLIAAGRTLKRFPYPTVRVWEEGARKTGPIVIEGTSVTDVYERAVQAADGATRPLICALDLPQNEDLPIPLTYPYDGDEKSRAEWFEQTVKWWQQPSSRIEARIPYIHGSRLRRFGGWFDQIERAVKILKAGQATSKAIAFVIDPTRDLSDKGPFASFCFVHLCLRQNRMLDCIGYYRTQEFRHWWPVNVAELRYLQLEVAKEAVLTAGRIITISGDPRLSQGRQPTKVAVPLIDQWVDTHPERIAMIATVLSDRDFTDGEELWRKCLKDMRDGTKDYDPDGVPAAIEGLELLMNWLRCTNGCEELVDTLQRLKRANEKLPNNPARRDFNKWKEEVTPLLDTLDKFPKRGEDRSCGAINGSEKTNQ